MTIKVVAIAIIGQDTLVFVIKTIAINKFFLKIIKVDKNNIYMEMALIEQNTTIILQITIIGPKI